MSITRLSVADAEVLERPGKRSTQIVSLHNAPQARATVTRVVMQPGAASPRHRHARAEQIWIVEHGAALLLLAEGAHEPVAAGDVVITPAGEVHGIENPGVDPFIYLTVTTLPEDMAGFYGVATGDAAHG